MNYFYFASYTTYGINMQSVRNLDAAHHVGTPLIVFTWHAVYVNRGIFMTHQTSDFINAVHMISLSAEI